MKLKANLMVAIDKNLVFIQYQNISGKQKQITLYWEEMVAVPKLWQRNEFAQ